ncbi:MAG: hypothetical protein ACRYFX_26515 [Janthinobacterium lividum]
MQFQQSQLTRSTQFALREHGFFVSQRDGRGQVDVAVEIPYEELLPVRLEYRSALPTQWLRWLGFGAWVLFVVLREYLFSARTVDFWIYAGGGAALLGLLVLYAWHNWWHQAILHTARMRVVLADHPRDRRQLRTFVDNLESYTKGYLRREYGLINPLGLIEPQLRRLGWLHELDVLSIAEAQALATRLTGRLPGRGFRSMGQKLDAPFVN